ncbi:hypothetical protein [Nitrobacter sp. TKz-YC02]|uniref:hypothetical protein n=1 Tax=Nitrobacter sp. TKz-YC02 TaxID=3398704 RepID=UPI003CE7953B
MYELKRTHARAAFKDLLGQANHFLITLLVGLSSVRDGIATLDDEFRTSWKPHDVKRSAERSRQFALDLSLVRAIDSLDAYMMQARKSPIALPTPEFASAMDGAGQKVSKRLEIFSNYLTPLERRQELFLKLAIDWRNRRVHSLASETIAGTELKELLGYSIKLAEEHRGLNIDALVSRYRANEAPSFKDAASVISLTHTAVKHFDQQLLVGLEIESYLRGLIMQALNSPCYSSAKDALRHACSKTWADPEKRTNKSIRILRMVGVHPTDKIEGRQVPDELVTKIATMTPETAFKYFSQTS